MTQKSFLIRFSIVVLGYGAMGGMIRYFGMVGIEKKPGKKEGAKDGQR